MHFLKSRKYHFFKNFENKNEKISRTGREIELNFELKVRTKNISKSCNKQTFLGFVRGSIYIKRFNARNREFGTRAKILSSSYHF